MIEADITPRLWDRIDLYLGDGSPIECAVRWLRNGRIGLEFAHETQHRMRRRPSATRCCSTSSAAASPTSRPPCRRSHPRPSPQRQVRTGAAVDHGRRHAPRRASPSADLERHDPVPARRRTSSACATSARPGALIDSPIDLPEGAELLLDLGAAGQYFATVGWSRGGQAGLVFASPFDLSVLAAAKPEVAPQQLGHARATSTCPRRRPRRGPSGWDRSDLADLRSDLEGFLKH